MRNILQIINKDKVTLAYLNNVESGTVKSVINGEYILSFTALIEPLKTEFLYDKNNLIEYNNDYFRVINIEEEHNSDNMLKVYVNCEHISYDLIKQTKLTYTQTDKAAIYVMNDLLLSSGFQFLGTDVTTTASIDIQKETDIKSLLYQVATIWGGELKYFRDTIEFKQQLGINRGTDFRFGKNVENLKRFRDFIENTTAYEIEVVQGAELEELGQYYLGDTIRVVDDALNIETEIRIIELETDIVTGLNSRVVLGQPIKDLSDSFNSVFNSIKNANSIIDNITIGGTNLFPKSKYGTTHYSSNISGHSGYGYLIPQGSVYSDTQASQISLKKNIDYMISFTAWADSEIILINDLYPDDLPEKHFTISTTPIKYSWKINSSSDNILNCRLRFFTDGTSNCYITDIKLEEGNKATSWSPAPDDYMSVIDEHGKLIAEKLTGTLNTAITKVQNSTGKTTFDDRGLIVHDQPIESTSTKAMLMTADGLLIANAKNQDGTWRWRTAVTGDSISADEITTGTLSAINIDGVNITGSKLVSESVKSRMVLDAGVFSILEKASTAQFNINYRDGLPANILQSELEYYNEFKATNPNKPANNTISLNSANSHMGLEFGNGAVSLGNNWVKQNMYGGTTDWRSAWTTLYDEYYAQHQNDPVYNPPPTTAQGSKFIIDLVGNAWVYRNQTGSGGYIIPPLVLGNSFFKLNAHYVDIDCIDTKVSGNFKVTGTKNCTIDTEKYGSLDFSAYETAEIYLGDIGENEIINGECVVNLDEKLLACVNTDLPYQVFLTPYGDGRIYVEQRNKTSFVVKGDNIKFGWEVKAKRKNYENIRFGEVR